MYLSLSLSLSIYIYIYIDMVLFIGTGIVILRCIIAFASNPGLELR